MKGLELIALIPTKDNGDTICDVVNNALEQYKKVVVMENSATEDNYKKIIDRYGDNKDLNVIKLDKPGKGNAIYNGIKHINKKYRGEYDFISTIDGDGETTIEDAVNGAFETRKKQDLYKNIAFGKGCNYSSEGSVISNAGIISKKLLQKYTEINKPNFKWDKIIDVRSGHHAITPEFVEIIETNEIKSKGYGIEMELLKLAFDNKMYVPHFKVNIEPRKSRYFVQDIPLEELLDFIELFGRDFVTETVKEEIGTNLVINYRQPFQSAGVYY